MERMNRMEGQWIGRVHGWIEEVDEWTEGVDGMEGWMDTWVSRQVGGWLDRCMDRWNGKMEELWVEG